jgi:hypothetical protein
MSRRCPSCGDWLFVAKTDPTVPTFPTCSDVRPVIEYSCFRCGLSYVETEAGPRRTSTVLADVLHRLGGTHIRPAPAHETGARGGDYREEQ